MHLLCLILTLLAFLRRSFCEVAVVKVVVRVPKENDIGLIFDLTVINNGEVKKEMLEFLVRSDGTCCLNVTSTRMMSGASRIYGGDFGSIEAGKTDTVSLIWPTVSLYNRVGYCPIIITSSNANNQEVHLKQILYFDTRFETLDPESHSLRKHKDYRDCKNWDKEYFKNCTPVNCEERYFGKRSFYNRKTEQCERVPSCTDPHMFYDIFANECVDKNKFVSEEDLEKIKQGAFDNNFLELHSHIPQDHGDESTKSNETKIVQKVKETQKTQKQPDKTHVKTNKNELINNAKGAKRSLHELEECFDIVRTDTDGIQNSSVEECFVNGLHAPRSIQFTAQGIKVPSWMDQLFNGFVLVLATIAIYLFICFIIFLFVNWLSWRPYGKSLAKITPRLSDDRLTIFTPSSLLSTR